MLLDIDMGNEESLSLVKVKRERSKEKSSAEDLVKESQQLRRGLPARLLQRWSNRSWLRFLFIDSTPKPEVLRQKALLDAIAVSSGTGTAGDRDAAPQSDQHFSTAKIEGLFTMRSASRDEKLMQASKRTVGERFQRGIQIFVRFAPEIESDYQAFHFRTLRKHHAVFIVLLWLAYGATVTAAAMLHDLPSSISLFYILVFVALCTGFTLFVECVLLPQEVTGERYGDVVFFFGSFLFLFHIGISYEALQYWFSEDSWDVPIERATGSIGVQAIAMICLAFYIPISPPVFGLLVFFLSPCYVLVNGLAADSYKNQTKSEVWSSVVYQAAQLLFVGLTLLGGLTLKDLHQRRRFAEQRVTKEVVQRLQRLTAEKKRGVFASRQVSNSLADVRVTRKVPLWTVPLEEVAGQLKDLLTILQVLHQNPMWQRLLSTCLTRLREIIESINRAQGSLVQVDYNSADLVLTPPTMQPWCPPFLAEVAQNTSTTPSQTANERTTSTGVDNASNRLTITTTESATGAPLTDLPPRRVARPLLLCRLFDPDPVSRIPSEFLYATESSLLRKRFAEAERLLALHKPPGDSGSGSTSPIAQWWAASPSQQGARSSSSLSPLHRGDRWQKDGAAFLARYVLMALLEPPAPGNYLSQATLEPPDQVTTSFGARLVTACLDRAEWVPVEFLHILSTGRPSGTDASEKAPDQPPLPSTPASRGTSGQDNASPSSFQVRSAVCSTLCLLYEADLWARLSDLFRMAVLLAVAIENGSASVSSTDSGSPFASTFALIQGSTFMQEKGTHPTAPPSPHRGSAAQAQLQVPAPAPSPAASSSSFSKNFLSPGDAWSMCLLVDDLRQDALASRKSFFSDHVNVDSSTEYSFVVHVKHVLRVSRYSWVFHQRFLAHEAKARDFFLEHYDSLAIRGMLDSSSAIVADAYHRSSTSVASVASGLMSNLQGSTPGVFSSESAAVIPRAVMETGLRAITPPHLGGILSQQDGSNYQASTRSESNSKEMVAAGGTKSSSPSSSKNASPTSASASKGRPVPDPLELHEGTGPVGPKTIEGFESLRACWALYAAEMSALMEHIVLPAVRSVFATCSVQMREESAIYIAARANFGHWQDLVSRHTEALHQTFFDPSMSMLQAKGVAPASPNAKSLLATST
ncbi:unnamed protein product [Amoebophrya sp. A120]|nr:unnamed protein product [Amoebophrya sp. A120]|eukprot:GSA120T00005521001.1